ncbi:glycogen phosphorylase 1-like isoform X2 [Prunus yedoensis var. nudiflora]|uniref:Alpha-1,4 glucan phosphorylase n=1 Tax=Prunus yedoensis var. nudiflora TaxID=2094558 RepID=A0A314V1P2_PRUYE|nr:glycogen phosphorylase 1-like isoform X2 [Prunus yedoensis var. nudiflora]
MANLAIVCSHTVNGVSKVHSELLKAKLFKDFYEQWPLKFQCKTDGVTQKNGEIHTSKDGFCSLCCYSYQIELMEQSVPRC